ncbi:Cytochrome c [Rubritalea squalenifaciens DSM 18772]|uniref:Cytochrome c n=1 Tax=Rubritalea squalenifaciens DSM 18772 TaxID=1123071 RepID=A0A1M6DCT3_9BACT|nr:cytochrome c [Rubritalea squalenifaciens]SHI71097.1 Cytochrome c [Rubritalea squalenifaciens DSM 18772]
MKKLVLFAAVLAAPFSLQANDGQTAYQTCMACHGADGKGMKAGPNTMAPSLAGSKLVNGNPELLAKIILKGIHKEDQKYMMVMAPLEAAYADDQKLADVINYVRNSFGNKNEKKVTAEDAKKYREAAKDIKAPLKRADLEKAAAKKAE